MTMTLKGFDGVEFDKYIQECFLRQYVEGPTRERAKLLGNLIKIHNMRGIDT